MTLTKDWLQKFGWPNTLITGHPLAIAHRGARDYAPENTLKSFRIAADLCSEMWELDIRMSADGVCVIAHDDNLQRVCGQDVLVSETSWAEIAALSLPEGQHVPRLEQVIELAQEKGCGLYLEIKSAGAGLAAWKILQEAGFRFAVLASFNVSWIKELREAMCDYPLGCLVPASYDPISYLAELRADIVHLCWRNASDHPDELLSDDLLQKLQAQGLQVVLWDEDRPAVLEKLWCKPIMGICSDRPELLKPYRPNPAQPIDIICHRGANKIAPENTLEAAKICFDQNFQFVELDVRTTSDGVLVVMHDADIARTTNGQGLVIDKTLTEIEKLDAGSWFSSSAGATQVPTLQQFLIAAKGQSGLYIEIKHADPAVLLQIVSSCNMLEHCFFWGLDINVMHWLRARSKDIVLMAPRWMYGSVTEAVSAYSAQIVEFDVEKDDLSEIALCKSLGVRSMIYSRRSNWDDLAAYLKFAPDMVNLDYPDRFKILASYPQVRHYFANQPEG